MIKVVSKGIFNEDKINEAIILYGELAIESRKEKGCIEYLLFQDQKDKTILTMIEEWESNESLVDHQNTDHFKRIVPMLKPIRKSTELNIYELLL